MSGARVLIVEDDPELRRVLQRGLAEEGFEPAAVATGAELLARADSDSDADMISAAVNTAIPITTRRRVLRFN